MVEALKNHNPQTIIIDEIATASDAQAVRNLVQRGVQVIATAHSCHFVDFFQNPEFKHVSGMVQGDDGGHRTLPERVQDPAFQVSFLRWAVPYWGHYLGHAFHVCEHKDWGCRQI